VGLPVWNDKEMVRRLYPGSAAAGSRLARYARLFNAIEFNSSGYGLDPAKAGPWAAETPPGFLFHPKVPRDITHGPDLLRAAGAFDDFARAAHRFGDRLGFAHLQFPDSFGPARFRELEAFLRLAAVMLPLAVEVRHEAWFRPGAARESLFGVLESLGLPAVITDTPGRRDLVHMRLTTPKLFLRFCGHDRSPPDRARLEAWIGRLGEWKDRGLAEAHVFLHHVPVDVGIDWAEDAIPALNRRLGTDLAAPVPAEAEEPQLDLFADG
jgi:uncharacterized protein YecE (DUF72 family)